LLLLISLAACGGWLSGGTPTPSDEQDWRAGAGSRSTPTSSVPAIDITLTDGDVTVNPASLRAGFPFTITAVVHNNTGSPISGVPMMVTITSENEEIGYSPFVEVLTFTLPATRPATIEVPVRWNLAGGTHRLWVQVNRLPTAWQPQAPPQPEQDTGDNSALLELMVQPFDAYTSDLCPGRADLEIGPDDIAAEAGAERVGVRVHNPGNQAAYNVPVVVEGEELSGIGYTPSIPPCGGTAEVWVGVDRSLRLGEALRVHVNPEGWSGGLVEEEHANNEAGAPVALPVSAFLSEAVDYDFSISAADIELPEPWLLLVTVHNLGTRDADRVPIRVANLAGRRVNDVIPLVQGNGLGVAAIRVGSLWTRGGTLTLTVNARDAKGAYSEADHSNNVATFSLP
jgi:hypothetical protein